MLLVFYLVSAAATVWVAGRLVAPVPRRVALAILLLPLLFTGKALLLGRLYGPSDLYGQFAPWKPGAAALGIEAPHNPILSDLAFANLPWRAAVREAVVNGRAPLWNRFVLSGNPLLGAAQAGIFHPAVWIAILLPVALSFTFSCAYTMLLALLSAWLFFSDLRLRPAASLAGAIGWGFSTYLLFWVGWSVGPAIATLPLLLLGLRTIARRPGLSGVALTAVALALSLFGGHPESTLHATAAGGVYFLWELAGRGRREAGRAVAASLLAGLLAILLSAPALFPFLECLPRSAEWRQRSAEVSRGASDQSASARDAVARMLPVLLPFAHGIYGKSPVDESHRDGAGMPLAYAGAILFPLAAFGALSRAHAERGRAIFAAFAVAGVLLGASAPGLIDVVSTVPLFSVALNYRAVFLAALGLSGLAAFGVEEAARGGARKLAACAAATAALLVGAFVAAEGVFASRGLPREFVEGAFAAEIVPVVLLGALAMARPSGRQLAAVAILLLAAQRAVEMHATYPTLRAETLAPPLPGLARLARETEPFRIVAPGDVFRPNGAALYGLEDVRGYESIVLDRYDDVRRLFSIPQHASFNRVEDLGNPLLSLLNVRFAIVEPGGAGPNGWRAAARSRESALYENPTALARAFLPARVVVEPDPNRRLAAIAAARDFSQTAWLDAPVPGVAGASGPGDPAAGRLAVRAIGNDLALDVEAAGPLLVATSVPAWPGWLARTSEGTRLPIATVNHAFVGLAVPPGRHAVRLTYRPVSFVAGLLAGLAGWGLLAGLALRRRRV